MHTLIKKQHINGNTVLQCYSFPLIINVASSKAKQEAVIKPLVQLMNNTVLFYISEIEEIIIIIS